MLKIPMETRGAVRHIFLAIIVGLCGGAGAIIFRETIFIIQKFFFGFILKSISYQYYDYNISIILLPTIGGILVGLIATKIAIEAIGDGVPDVMGSIHIHGGKIRKRVGFTRIIASAITIGSGGSAGREGPIAQIGASFGSLVGQVGHLNERWRKILTASGLAAGLGATFNAPLGAAIFTMEVLFTEFEAISATSIILASVVGTTFSNAITKEFLTEHSVIELGKNLTFNHPFELSFYLLLGLTLGFLSILWVKIFYKIEDFFDSLRIPLYIKTALGGLCVGVIGIFTLKEIPDGGPLGYGIMGVGYEGVNMALMGKLSLILLIILGIVKIIATSFTVGSGGSGGIFSPSLYIGAMFGGALGILFNYIAPDIAQVPETYALVGMGAFFAATANAPLTTIIMIPEMSKDYFLIPAMMMACITSYVINSLFMKDSIYTLKLAKKGVPIDIDHVLSEIRVEDIMSKKVDSVSKDITVREFIDKMWREGHIGYPVVDNNKNLYGIVTFDDLHDVSPDDKISDICTRNVLTVNPKDSVQIANKIILENDIGRLVVVDNKNPKRIVGIISKTDILRAYHKSLRLKRTWQD